MKKVLKSSILFLLLSILLVGLVACGKEEHNNTDKLVATKQLENIRTGNYTEKVEITYEDNKATKIKIRDIYETEKKASNMYKLFNFDSIISEDEEKMLENIETKLEGKEIVIMMDVKDSYKENFSKEAIKNAFEENGYTIEK